MVLLLEFYKLYHYNMLVGLQVAKNGSLRKSRTCREFL